MLQKHVVDLNWTPHVIANVCMLGRSSSVSLHTGQGTVFALGKTQVNPTTPPCHPSPRFSRKTERHSERNSESWSEVGTICVVLEVDLRGCVRRGQDGRPQAILHSIYIELA